MTLTGSEQLIWQGPTANSHPNDPNVFDSLTFYSLKWITLTMHVRIFCIRLRPTCVCGVCVSVDLCEMSAVGQMEGEKCERRQTFFPINFLWSILIIERLIARNCFRLLMEEPTASFTTRNLKVASVDHCPDVHHSYILQF